MKQFNSLRFLILIFSLFSIISSDAQVQTPRFISIPGANSNGFYEYLPLGYNPTGTKTYPLNQQDVIGLYVSLSGDFKICSLELLNTLGGKKAYSLAQGQ